MRVCAGKTLAIRGEFAVENGPMTLALNLDEKHKITTCTETCQDTNTQVFNKISILVLNVFPCRLFALAYKTSK